MTTKRKKPRSPLRGARRPEIAALRALTIACLHWERALGTPGQYLEPEVPWWALSALGFGSIERARTRRLTRWQRMPHFPESHAVWLDQHLKQYDRKAWEMQQLRTVVTDLSARLGAIDGKA